MKKVLVITYYWPPSGGSQVLRWLKFSKYLPEFRWEPVIYTPENPEPQQTDNSLIQEIPDTIKVIKRSIWEPYKFYRIINRKKKGEKISTAFISEKKSNNIIDKASNFIRSNFFIPDARKFWIKPSFRFLKKYIKNNTVDLIVSSGPPHSMHIIAFLLKKNLNIPWIADFRDPWTKIDYYKELLLTSWADRRHHRLEKKVLTTADFVLAVGPTMKEEFIKAGARNVKTITNGFDDYKLPADRIKQDSKFSITHVGSIPKSRNAEILWKAISELIKTQKGFGDNLQINLIGKVDYSVIDSLNKYNLINFTIQNEYIPHLQALKRMSMSQVLLLLINNTQNAKGILTNKFFEYLSVKRPILAIGPTDGDIAGILASSRAGKISDFDDLNNLKENIASYYNMYLMDKLEISSGNIDRFSRLNLTRELVTTFQEVIK
ncbi:MAG: glycosyltransferase [Bacteroidales bacterium]|nr:MAG: glycosyltransferase [Bacteroidales bacterium]